MPGPTTTWPSLFTWKSCSPAARPAAPPVARHRGAEWQCGCIRRAPPATVSPVDGQPLTLTAQEHKILAYLMHHPNRVLTRTEISEHVYARDLDPDSNTLDVLIGRIRRKLGQPQLLVTERGQGFRLHSAPTTDDRPRPAPAPLVAGRAAGAADGTARTGGAGVGRRAWRL